MEQRAPHAVRLGRSALVLGGEVGKDWSGGWLVPVCSYVFLRVLLLFCFVGSSMYTVHICIHLYIYMNMCIIFFICTIYKTSFKLYIQYVHSRTSGSHWQHNPLAQKKTLHVRPDLAKKKSELIKQQNEFKVTCLQYSMVMGCFKIR